MTKKRKAKGTAVKAWGLFRADGLFLRGYTTRRAAREDAWYFDSSIRVRPIRITILEGKG